MPIIPFPRDVLAGIQWQQQGGRPQVQRSVFTGRATQLDFGAAARWRASGSVVPMWDDAQRTIWAGFEAACQVPGNTFRLPVVESGQAGGNLIENPTLDAGTAPWVTGSGYARQASDAATGLVSPSEWSFVTTSAANGQFCVANNGTRPAIAEGQRLFMGAHIAFAGGTTGDVAMYAAFYNSGGTLISPLVVLISASLGALGEWRRIAGFVTAPAGTASVSLNISNGLTAGTQWVALPRASLLPERATVNGSANAGRTLALSGLALSQRNLRAGQFITVTLPGGDEQLIRLAADLVADGSGNGTASLATPLRRTPAAGAAVELDQPWALMRATHAPGWGVDNQNIYGHDFEAEEAF